MVLPICLEISVSKALFLLSPFVKKSLKCIDLKPEPGACIGFSNRCGVKVINVVEVIRLIEVKEIAYLQW